MKKSMIADIYDLLLVRAGHALTRGRWRLIGTVMATPFGPVYRPVWFHGAAQQDPPGWLAWWKGASERVDAELTWFQFRAHVEGPIREPAAADFDDDVEDVEGEVYICPSCGEHVLIPDDDV